MDSDRGELEHCGRRCHCCLPRRGLCESDSFSIHQNAEPEDANSIMMIMVDYAEFESPLPTPAPLS